MIEGVPYTYKTNILSLSYVTSPHNRILTNKRKFTMMDIVEVFLNMNKRNRMEDFSHES